MRAVCPVAALADKQIAARKLALVKILITSYSFSNGDRFSVCAPAAAPRSRKAYDHQRSIIGRRSRSGERLDALHDPLASIVGRRTRRGVQNDLANAIFAKLFPVLLRRLVDAIRIQ